MLIGLALLVPYLLVGSLAFRHVVKPNLPAADRAVLGFGLFGLVLVPLAGLTASSVNTWIICFLLVPFLVSVAYLARTVTARRKGSYAAYYMGAGLGLFLVTGVPLLVIFVVSSALSGPVGH